MIEVTLTGSGVATAEGITVDYEKRARGAPICDLARKLSQLLIVAVYSK